MWQFLAAVEEEFDAAEARLVGLELEAPFYHLGLWARRAGHGVGVQVGRGRGGPEGRGGVADFGGDFVGGYAIAAGPAVVEVKYGV